MAGMGGGLRRELRLLVPPVVFFLIAFNLLALTAALARPGENGVFTYAAASIAALICGKAVLIADYLPFFDRYPHRPLIWNVLWKSMLYVAITGAIRLAEQMIRGWLGNRHLGGGIEHAIAAFDWRSFVVVQLWLTVLFLIYTGFAELMLAVGRDKVARLFFGPVEARDA